MDVKGVDQILMVTLLFKGQGTGVTSAVLGKRKNLHTHHCAKVSVVKIDATRLFESGKSVQNPICYVASLT